MMFMKYYSCLFLIVFFSNMSLFSQEKYKKHTVSKGETISEIAQKYNVQPSTIYELNPDAVNGINWKTVLLIPTNIKNNKSISSSATPSKLPENTHKVLSKETLYGIAKQHHISIEDLYKVNPNLEKEGLKIGQTIKVPSTAVEDFAVTKDAEKPIEIKKPNASKENVSKEKIVVASKTGNKTEIPTEGIEYEVLPKETLYSIAKKYGIKIADLQKANSELENTSLKVGQKIILPVKADVNSNPIIASKGMISKQEVTVLPQTVVVKKEAEVAKTIPALTQITDDTTKLSSNIIHEVLPKESLYAIAKQYGITVSDLKKANSELENTSLKVGQKIRIPVKTDANSSLVAEKVTTNKEVKAEKELVITPQVTIDLKNTESEITHEVLPKETKYGIAKQYGLTVAELEKQNPNISKKLLVGSLLKIRTSKPIERETDVEKAIVPETVSIKDKFENKESNIVRDATFADQLISKASENIGTRYRLGGTTTEGFDCSGLMCYAFGSYDIKLPRTSIEMASYGSIIDVENAQKGDLIFFKTNGRSRINHVGMVVEVLEDEIKFIHSSTHGGVIISSTKESYYKKKLAQVNRVL
jgi:LysM repeat protein